MVSADLPPQSPLFHCSFCSGDFLLTMMADWSSNSLFVGHHPPLRDAAFDALSPSRALSVIGLMFPLGTLHCSAVRRRVGIPRWWGGRRGFGFSRWVRTGPFMNVYPYALLFRFLTATLRRRSPFTPPCPRPFCPFALGSAVVWPYKCFAPTLPFVFGSRGYMDLLFDFPRVWEAPFGCLSRHFFVSQF